MDAAAAAERERIEREIHDGPLQALQVARLLLAATDGWEPGDPRFRETVDRASVQLDAAARGLRDTFAKP